MGHALHPFFLKHCWGTLCSVKRMGGKKTLLILVKTAFVYRHGFIKKPLLHANGISQWHTSTPLFQCRTPCFCTSGNLSSVSSRVGCHAIIIICSRKKRYLVYIRTSFTTYKMAPHHHRLRCRTHRGTAGYGAILPTHHRHPRMHPHVPAIHSSPRHPVPYC